jgi:hypothetical protein
MRVFAACLLLFSAFCLVFAEFEQHGAAKAEIMMDKMTNRSRGFGFVWFNSRAGMEDAIRDKHNSEIDGRRISVKEAIPQEQIPPGAFCCFWFAGTIPVCLLLRFCFTSVKGAIPQEQIPPGAFCCVWFASICRCVCCVWFASICPCKPLLILLWLMLFVLLCYVVTLCCAKQRGRDHMRAASFLWCMSCKPS